MYIYICIYVYVCVCVCVCVGWFWGGECAHHIWDHVMRNRGGQMWKQCLQLCQYFYFCTCKASRALHIWDDVARTRSDTRESSAPILEYTHTHTHTHTRIHAHSHTISGMMSRAEGATKVKAVPLLPARPARFTSNLVPLIKISGTEILENGGLLVHQCGRRGGRSLHSGMARRS